MLRRRWKTLRKLLSSCMQIALRATWLTRSQNLRLTIAPWFLDLLKSIEANENCSSSGTHDADDLWRQKLLVRRAKAHIALKKLHHARNDLGAAVDMGENRADISRDLKRCVSVLFSLTQRACRELACSHCAKTSLVLCAPTTWLLSFLDFRESSKQDPCQSSCMPSLVVWLREHAVIVKPHQTLFFVGGINTWERNGRRTGSVSDDEIIHDDTAHRCVDIGVEWNNVVIGLLIKILHRRGAAAAHVQRYHHAVSDYQFAAGLMIEKQNLHGYDASVIYHVAFKQAEGSHTTAHFKKLCTAEKSGLHVK